jgi:YegS/Rv2252/BmrU family lipid kinase
METPLSKDAEEYAVAKTPPATAVIITNPISGVFPHHQTDHAHLVNLLQEQGWQVEVWPTRGQGDASALARQAVEQQIRVVIAAGGDGTINEVIQGLAGSETALGVLPTGTVNVWAREMGLPSDSAKVSAILTQGRTRQIDLGRVNERYFLLMVGVGLDGEVAHAVERRSLKRLGVLGYALAALWFGPAYVGFPVTLKIDGAAPERSRTLQIVVGNTRLYAGACKFTWLARCDDGLLDLCVVRQRGLWGRLLMVRDLVLRREPRRLWVDYSTFQTLEIETPHPVALQIDGDHAGYTPATFTVVPGALKVIVPQDAPEDLFSLP